MLESAGREGWSVLICSHDLQELEMLADWVGFIDHGRILLSEPMEELRARYNASLREIFVRIAREHAAPAAHAGVSA